VYLNYLGWPNEVVNRQHINAGAMLYEVDWSINMGAGMHAQREHGYRAYIPFGHVQDPYQTDWRIIRPVHHSVMDRH
jgi:hypothetical protein